MRSVLLIQIIDLSPYRIINSSSSAARNVEFEFFFFFSQRDARLAELIHPFAFVLR